MSAPNIIHPVDVMVIEEDDIDRRSLAQLFGGWDGKAIVFGFDRSFLYPLRKGEVFGAILISFSRSPDIALKMLKVINHEFPSIPVVMMGNFGLFDRIDEFKSWGASAIIHKPFSAACIFETLNKLIIPKTKPSVVLPKRTS